MRTSGNNYQIDGADNNDAFQNAAAVNQGGVSGIAGTLLPIEAIDQFSVQSNAGAETGRNGGSSVNVVIKSGTNALHGSAYYFNRNEALAVALAVPDRRQPQTGHPQQPVRLLGRRSDRQEQDLLLHQRRIAALHRQQLAARHAFLPMPGSPPAGACWRSTASPVNPVSLNLLTIWPASTRTGPAATNNYLSNGRNDYNSYNGIIKLDHTFNEKHSISARYFGGTGTQTADVGSHIRDFFQVAPSHMHNVSIVENADPHAHPGQPADARRQLLPADVQRRQHQLQPARAGPEYRRHRSRP